eukprot:Colp12_sorted_trinity150504_noHs@4151
MVSMSGLSSYEPMDLDKTEEMEEEEEVEQNDLPIQKKPVINQVERRRSKIETEAPHTRELPPQPSTEYWEVQDYGRHLMFPYMIMGYLQLFFNICVIAFMLYIAIQFVWALQKDIDIKVEEYSQEIMKEIAMCSKSYKENRCAPEERIPAMELTCSNWEKCMLRDPRVVGRARVSAETFAEIINSFVEPISYKTMAFFGFFLFGLIFLSNYAFHFARSRVVPPQPHTAHYPQSPMLSPPRYASGHGNPFYSGTPTKLAY